MSAESLILPITQSEFASGQEQKEVEPSRELLVVGHTYQPHRETWIPSTGQRLLMAPSANDLINKQVYEPIFEAQDELPRGVFSYWAPLRDWKMAHTPEGFATAREKIRNVENREYQMLGDTYMHIIMPLQTPEDQEMMIEIGKKAFEDDFDFTPKGAWLAETAVSSDTLRALHKTGYEFVVLRDNQIQSCEQNPMYVPVEEHGEEVGEIAVVHFDSGLSGSVSYEDERTVNADRFLDEVRSSWKRDVAIGSDTELYGHHKPFRDKFLEYVTRPDVLKQHGFAPFDVKGRLESGEHARTYLREKTSWSCEHQLGRWTGECDCDNPSWEAIQDKKNFYRQLTDYGLEINARLAAVDRNWRSSFMPFFLGVRKSWFGKGDVEADIKNLQEDNDPQLALLHDETTLNLFKAKMCELVGKTSCGWFFPEVDRPERELPRVMIEEIKLLVPDFPTQGVIFAPAA